jgi:type I restriction enzyme S subunit
VPLPPIPEQRRIAAILDQADALRAKRREALAQLDSLTQSIFIEMFGDPAENPKGWTSVRLEDVSQVGSSKRVFVEELVDAGIPFYRGTEVGQLGEGLPVEPSLFITHEHFERLKGETGIPAKGDLLLPSICPDGRIFMVQDDKPFYFKDGRVPWINVNKSCVDSVFLRQQLKHLFASNYSKIASGTTFAELKIFALKNLCICLPPHHLQERFASVVDVIKKQTDSFNIQKNEFDNFFGALQHRAFRGEL